VVPRDFLGLPILIWALLVDRLPARLAEAITRAVSWLSFGRLDRIGLRPLPYGPLTQIDLAFPQSSQDLMSSFVSAFLSGPEDTTSAASRSCSPGHFRVSGVPQGSFGSERS
jgi:hypothetical protein